MFLPSAGGSAFAAPTFTAGAGGPIPLASAGTFGGSGSGTHLREVRQSGFLGMMRGAQPAQLPPPMQHHPLMGGMGSMPPMMPLMPPMPSMPTPPPASGTILAAMGGERRPIMHPTLGMIGYSNAPERPGMLPGMGKKRK